MLYGGLAERARAFTYFNWMQIMLLVWMLHDGRFLACGRERGQRGYLPCWDRPVGGTQLLLSGAPAPGPAIIKEWWAALLGGGPLPAPWIVAGTGVDSICCERLRTGTISRDADGVSFRHQSPVAAADPVQARIVDQVIAIGWPPGSASQPT